MDSIIESFAARVELEYTNDIQVVVKAKNGKFYIYKGATRFLTEIKESQILKED